MRKFVITEEEKSRIKSLYEKASSYPKMSDFGLEPVDTTRIDDKDYVEDLINKFSDWSKSDKPIEYRGALKKHREDEKDRLEQKKNLFQEMTPNIIDLIKNSALKSHICYVKQKDWNSLIVGFDSDVLKGNREKEELEILIKNKIKDTWGVFFNYDIIVKTCKK